MTSRMPPSPSSHPPDSQTPMLSGGGYKKCLTEPPAAHALGQTSLYSVGMTITSLIGLSSVIAIIPVCLTFTMKGARRSCARPSRSCG